MPPLDKHQLLELLRCRLHLALDSLVASHKAAQAAVVHPDAKQEHAKDMRGTEASYVARGLAERVETLRDSIRALELMPLRHLGVGERVIPGALVTVADEGGRESLYLLAPAGGGEKIEIDGHAVLVLTPQSPLGAALAGRRLGDSFAVNLPLGRVALEIVSID